METKKLNKLLLVSFVLGLLYGVYILYYVFSTFGSASGSAEAVGVGLAITLAMPHIICAVLAVIFNGLGLFMNKRGFALTGAILYTVACAIFPLWFMFTIIQAILSYIGYAKMRNK